MFTDFQHDPDVSTTVCRASSSPDSLANYVSLVSVYPDLPLIGIGDCRISLFLFFGSPYGTTFGCSTEVLAGILSRFRDFLDVVAWIRSRDPFEFTASFRESPELRDGYSSVG